jgi:hypothetical protein
MSHASYPISVQHRRVGGLVFVKTIHLGKDHRLVQRAVEYMVKVLLCIVHGKSAFVYNVAKMSSCDNKSLASLQEDHMIDI